MPRPLTPTEVLSVRGAFVKHPERKRPIGPKSKRPLGDPPDYFDEFEAAIWRETVGNCAAGVLTSADRVSMELISLSLAKVRRREPLSGAERGQMTALLSRMGMTPADRSRIHADPEPEKSQFDEFLQ